MKLNNRGFTLIELLIVVVILAILAAVGMPAFNNYRLDSQVAATATDIRALQQAAELAFLENGEWPGDKNPGIMPPEMNKYLLDNAFDRTAPIGGIYDWQQNFGATAAVSIFDASQPQAKWTALDEIVDDGNIFSGKVRIVNDNYLFFLLEE